jgi:hypothetical protein
MIYIIIFIICIIAVFAFNREATSTYLFTISSQTLNNKNEPTESTQVTKKCTMGEALLYTQKMLKKYPKHHISCYNMDKNEVLLSNKPITQKTQYGMGALAVLGLLVVGCAPEKPVQNTMTVNTPVKMQDTIIAEFNESGCVIDSSQFIIYNMIRSEEHFIHIIDSLEPMSGHYTTRCALYDTATAMNIRRAYWKKHINLIH